MILGSLPFVKNIKQYKNQVPLPPQKTIQDRTIMGKITNPEGNKKRRSISHFANYVGLHRILVYILQMHKNEAYFVSSTAPINKPYVPNAAKILSQHINF